MRRALLLAACGAASVALACSNAGESRILSVGATGVVRGTVYFDRDGDRQIGAPDTSLGGIRVRLLAKNSNDTIASAVSAATGLYLIADVPVGTYLVRVDTTPLIDTAIVAKIDSAEITVLPADSASINVGISYPHVTIAAARLLAPGRKVFVEGIVLNRPSGFSDTTMHVQDVTAAIRTTRVRSTLAVASDSVRLRGTTSRRDGLPTLDDITTFILLPSFLPPATTVTTAQAVSAVGGTRDARQLQVLLATVTDTLTVPGIGGVDIRLTVNDGSGALEVLLDHVADPAAFHPPPPPTLFIPGNKFDIVGIAVPTGTPGLWRLKPTSSTALIKR